MKTTNILSGMSQRAMLVTALLAFPILSCTAGATAAFAQSTVVPDKTNEGWKVSLYPVLAWLPLYGADLQTPPPDGGGGVGGQLNPSWNQGFFAGMSVERARWRVEFDGMWVSLHGDRPDNPRLDVDLDATYAHGTVSVRLGRDVFLTGGFRRLGVYYDVSADNGETLSRSPGLWDPLVGVAWHHEAGRWVIHANLEGGGFGVGTDAEVFGAVRGDWKPTTHVGLTLGYTGWYFKITDTVAGRTFRATQTLHGPIVGIGLYF